MKYTKIIALLLGVALLATSCSGAKDNTQQAANTPETTEQTEIVSTDIPEEETAAETKEEPAAEVSEAPAEEVAEEVTEESAPAEAVTGSLGEGIVARVNGEDVTEERVIEIYNNLVSYYSQYGYDTSDETMQGQLMQIALDNAVQLKILDQKAKEMGLDQLTEEEIKATTDDVHEYWESFIVQYIAAYHPLGEDATDADKAAAREQSLAEIAGLGLSEQDLLDSELEGIVYDRVQAEMVKGAEVSDEEVEAEFKARAESDRTNYESDVFMYEYMTMYYGQESYYVPEGYRGITHILLQVDPELLQTWKDLQAKLEEQEEDAENGVTPTDMEGWVTQEMVDEAYNAVLDSVKDTTDEIYAKLDEGVPFSELVETYGTDPGMKQEPNKTDGYAVHMDSVVWDPAFVKAAFSVENVGDVAQPVVGQNGVHIVQYTKDVPSGPVEFTDEIKASIYADLLQQKEEDLYSSTMKQWMEESTIEYAAVPAQDELPADDTTEAEAPAD